MTTTTPPTDPYARQRRLSELTVAWRDSEQRLRDTRASMGHARQSIDEAAQCPLEDQQAAIHLLGLVINYFHRQVACLERAYQDQCKANREERERVAAQEEAERQAQEDVQRQRAALAPDVAACWLVPLPAAVLPHAALGTGPLLPDDVYDAGFDTDD